MIDFQTHPDRYRHWQLSFSDRVAYLTMSVDPHAGLSEGYELKLNSYDLGVDIELYDAIQRLRFEHPEIGAVVIKSNLDRVFCAGANIKMLGQSSHAHKVNFCKFTNETRNAIEDATEYSSQRYISAINGTAAGGGYELALCTDHIILVDDGNAAVSLPEVPLLAVLPGTGGLTRLVDKRKVRRDLADVFCTIEEGIKGQRVLDWRLVDELVATSQFEQRVDQCADEFAQTSDRPVDVKGITLSNLQREISDDQINYSSLHVELDRAKRLAELTIFGPESVPPESIEDVVSLEAAFWPLRLARELDDALLHLRVNESEIGTLVLKSKGGLERGQAFEKLMLDNVEHWLIREIILYWKRTLKRLDVTSKTTFALVEPGGCFGGLVAELIFAADRTYMLEGDFEDNPGEYAAIKVSEFNFGPLPMANGITRLQTRFLGEPEAVDQARTLIGQDLLAAEALAAGLITYAPDDIDWEDEIRLLLEERSSFSADSLTGLEANLRFAGPETMETKIFGRLSAWQNWIFQRPNAVSEHGALQLYGSGIRPKYNPERV